MKVTVKQRIEQFPEGSELTLRKLEDMSEHDSHWWTYFKHDSDLGKKVKILEWMSKNKVRVEMASGKIVQLNLSPFVEMIPPLKLGTIVEFDLKFDDRRTIKGPIVGWDWDDNGIECTGELLYKIEGENNLFSILESELRVISE